MYYLICFWIVLDHIFVVFLLKLERFKMIFSGTTSSQEIYTIICNFWIFGTADMFLFCILFVIFYYLTCGSLCVLLPHFFPATCTLLAYIFVRYIVIICKPRDDE